MDVVLYFFLMNMKNLISLLLFLLIMGSCIKSNDLYEDNSKDDGSGITDDVEAYIYPFAQENQNTVAEITIKTDGQIPLSNVTTEIPYLKYNKSWLFMLTQDDCKQAAYSCTWAAINGKPYSNTYYYDAAQLKVGDLPPDVYLLNRTLGSTDGAGNEVRFSFTTTLSPEMKWMSRKVNVTPGYKGNYFRFHMKDGLTWNDVKEILNYGSSIAFHDVQTSNISNLDSIEKHYAISQSIILNHLSGRGCKMLAEPNGNKAYVNAALRYEPIQIMTAQTGTIKLYPFQVNEDLNKDILNRTFYEQDDPFYFIKEDIRKQLALNEEERQAIHVGVHGTDENWVRFLLWLDKTYGKDGDDSVWFPSMEEYYEYNYYRIHGSVSTTILNDSMIKLTVDLPSKQYFYYPSTTINLKTIPLEHIKSISSSDEITGLSYGKYSGNGIMININCRKYLLEFATHFVEQYESNKTESNRVDGLYFVNMLKSSEQKEELKERLVKR